VLYDISVPMSARTPEWPGDQRFDCGWTCRLDKGDSVNLAAVTTSLHVGTHADAPLHVHDGWPASESLTVSAFVGPCVVLSLPAAHIAVQEVDTSMLAALLEAQGHRDIPARMLLRTGRSVAAGVFPEDWPTLSADTATWLVSQGLVLWGVDAPSVDTRHSKTLDVHHALLGRGAFVLENLDLRAVEPGDYELLAAPLSMEGADAAPVRALLRAGGALH